MHPAQVDFLSYVIRKYPKFKSNVSVLDVGSQNINGTNRRFFSSPFSYVGLDIGPGKNIDVICKIHLYNPKSKYDVVISGEMLEHDKHWKESIARMCYLTRAGGLLTFTCATTGRKTHGTEAVSPKDSPFTTDYYKNLTEEDVRTVLDFDKTFDEYEFKVNTNHYDLYFHGIKGIYKPKIL